MENSKKVHKAHPTRDKWGRQLEFILCCLGYAVGLGNFWRFPYMCGQNGGAAFMIPYFIMMIFAGFPIFYMEVALGQYMSLAPHKIYAKMCPVFAGIGYAMLCITSFKSIYYNMVLAYVLYYFGVSFTSRLPWSDCSHEWNTYACRSNECFNSTHVSFLGSQCYERSRLNTTDVNLFANDTIISQYINENPLNGTETILSDIEHNLIHGNTPAHEFFYNRVLQRTTGIHDIGGLKWDLVLCYLVAWFLVFLCLVKGIKSSGKVVYFTATFPYLILTVLLVRGLTLDGAIDGVWFFINPNFKYLKEANTWGKAAGQIFFSCALGYGGLPTLASYNKFTNNFFRDSVIVVLADTLTSVLAGFVVFPIVGFIAKQTGRTVAETAAGGPGLVFIAYADALARMPAAPFWSVIFFFMLVILALDTMIILVETVITAFQDQWPQLRKNKNKVIIDAVVCGIFFCFGLVLCTRGGSYVLTIVDAYAGGWTLLFTCLCEVLMVSYIYGYKRFMEDCKLMLGVPHNKFYKYVGYPVNPYWWVNWIIVAPLLIIGVILFNWIGYKPTKLNDYQFPVWSDLMGWAIALMCVSFIPVKALTSTLRVVNKNLPLKSLIEPTPCWGPQHINEQKCAKEEAQSETNNHHTTTC